ncbi:hypothetical protein B566_EDAN009034 [Ephemera danica]|nr:hypothetical protein B566_EDAN009034 [Ephemera danica]
MGFSDERTGDQLYYGECLVGRFYFRAHKNAIFDLTWMKNYAGALTMVTGAGDTTVAMWDAETHKRLCLFTCHDQCIRSVAAHRDIPGLLATGARDGKICIHDHRCEKRFPVNTITGAHIEPDEKCKFVGHSTSSKLSSYLQCGLSSCGRYLACGSSGDNFIHIWDTSQDSNFDASVPRDKNSVRSFQPVATLVEGHTDGVHCTQWSAKPGELKLASLSDDNTHRIWRLGAQSFHPPDAGPSQENPRNPSIGNEGYAVMSQAFLVKPRRKLCHHNNVIPVTSVLELSDLPNFVHNPDSVIHKCSPRVPKLKMNWLTALSPQNRSPSPSSGKVVKLPRPSTKRKSSKKLQLLQFKTILKPQPPKY